MQNLNNCMIMKNTDNTMQNTHKRKRKHRSSSDEVTELIEIVRDYVSRGFFAIGTTLALQAFLGALGMGGAEHPSPSCIAFAAGQSIDQISAGAILSSDHLPSIADRLAIIARGEAPLSSSGRRTSRADLESAVWDARASAFIALNSLVVNASTMFDHLRGKADRVRFCLRTASISALESTLSDVVVRGRYYPSVTSVTSSAFDLISSLNLGAMDTARLLRPSVDAWVAADAETTPPTLLSEATRCAIRLRVSGVSSILLCKDSAIEQLAATLRLRGESSCADELSACHVSASPSLLL